MLGVEEEISWEHTWRMKNREGIRREIKEEAQNLPGWEYLGGDRLLLLLQMVAGRQN